MSVLLIDAGNSRLKWALLRSDVQYARGMRFVRRGVSAWGITGSISGVNASRLARSLFTTLGAVERVQVSNVAGPGVERALQSAARTAGVRSIDFARSARAAGGVRNAYADAWRLGVDRWLALIGAHHEYPRRALCVVSIGTATTIDLLDADGRHRGGSISPAPPLMIESLLRGTAGIRQRTQTSVRAPRTLFARSTRAALEAGARFSTAALIERAASEARRLLGARVQLVLAGGGADPVAALLRISFKRQDDLVLRGLALLASGHGNGHGVGAPRRERGIRTER